MFFALLKYHPIAVLLVPAFALYQVSHVIFAPLLEPSTVVTIGTENRFG